MDPRFDGIRAKLDRAAELLDAIEMDYGAYLGEQPYTALHELKPEAGRIITRLRIDRPVPVRLSVMFGEVAHQARSALDHLVCRLLEARDLSITRRSSFPVMTTEDDWLTRVERPMNAAGDLVGGPLAGLDPAGAAWAFIRSEQPFHADDPALHPLAQVNSLWNQDKHRNVNASNSYLDPQQILGAFSWTPTEVQPIEARVARKPSRPIKSGEALAVFTFSLDAMPSTFEISGPLNFEVAFGPADGRPRPEMKSTVAHVAQLVERAEPLLDND